MHLKDKAKKNLSKRSLSSKKRAVIAFGPPCAGKDTIAQNLVNHKGAVHLSMRDRIKRKAATSPEFKELAESHEKGGELIPCEYINNLAEEAVAENSEIPLLCLTGFGRTADQVIKLVQVLRKHGFTKIHLIDLNLTIDESTKRFLQTISNSDRQDRLDNVGDRKAVKNLHRSRHQLHLHHRSGILSAYKEIKVPVHNVDASKQPARVWRDIAGVALN